MKIAKVFFFLHIEEVTIYILPAFIDEFSAMQNMRNTTRSILWKCVFYIWIVLLSSSTLHHVTGDIEVKNWPGPYSNVYNAHKSFEEGIGLCAPHRHSTNVRATIEQLRNLWHLKLPIFIAHCSELTPYELYIIRTTRISNDTEIYLMNLCETPEQELLGMQGNQLTTRLRTYFCKTALLLVAPVKKLMIVDLDVIWFDSPKALFSTPLFVDSGLLFFRDRYVVLKLNEIKRGNKIKPFKRIMEQIYQNYSSHSLASKETEIRFKSQGIYSFWKYIVDDSLPGLENYQESSVILVDRSRHPDFLRMLTLLLPYFDLGWGDKEIYWIAGKCAFSL